MRKYIDWHAIRLFVVGAFSVAYPAAYPYLNPSNLQLETAAYYAVMGVAALIIYQHGRVSVKQQIVDSIPDKPTQQVPTPRASLPDLNKPPYTSN